MEEKGKYDVLTQQKELGMMVSPGNSMFLDIERFEFAKKVASMLAASPMVPKHFQGAEGVGSCMIALNLAERMRVDVFMLMQTMYVVHGNPGLEGKMIIALVNGCGRYEPLEFEFKGEGKTDKKNVARADECTATAKHIKTGKILRGPTVTWEMAVAEGWTKDKGDRGQTSKWQTMPELMFMYRSATFFARTNCPEVLMGLRTKDELEDMIIDITPGPAPLKIEGKTKVDESMKGEMYKTKDFKPEDNHTAEGTSENTTLGPEEETDKITKISKAQEPATFKQWVNDNKADIATWPQKRILEVQAKWNRLLLPFAEFPIFTKKPEVDNNGDTIWCKVKSGRVFVKVCEKCDKVKKCPEYEAYVSGSSEDQQKIPEDAIKCPMTGKAKPIHECEAEKGCPMVGDKGKFPEDACGVYKKAKGENK